MNTQLVTFNRIINLPYIQYISYMYVCVLEFN